MFPFSIGLPARLPAGDAVRLFAPFWLIFGVPGAIIFDVMFGVFAPVLVPFVCGAPLGVPLPLPLLFTLPLLPLEMVDPFVAERCC